MKNLNGYNEYNIITLILLTEGKVTESHLDLLYDAESREINNALVYK